MDNNEDKTVEQYKEEITKLQQQLKEAQNDDIQELKTKYDEIIDNKNQEIEDLKNNLEDTKQKVDDTVTDLNDEIQKKLDANEEYQKALATIKELEESKAKVTVDTLIQQGKILPAQRDTALKLCLNDPDTFSDLYRDAQPIIDTDTKRRSIPTGTAERIVNYFKN